MPALKHPEPEAHLENNIWSESYPQLREQRAHLLDRQPSGCARTHRETAEDNFGSSCWRLVKDATALTLQRDGHNSHKAILQSVPFDCWPSPTSYTQQMNRGKHFKNIGSVLCFSEAGVISIGENKTRFYLFLQLYFFIQVMFHCLNCMRFFLTRLVCSF